MKLMCSGIFRSKNIFLKFKKQGNAEVIDEVKIVDFGFGVKSDKNVKGLMGTPN